jgi:hypothetical protein
MNMKASTTKMMAGKRYYLTLIVTGNARGDIALGFAEESY